MTLLTKKSKQMWMSGFILTSATTLSCAVSAFTVDQVALSPNTNTVTTSTADAATLQKLQQEVAELKLKNEEQSKKISELQNNIVKNKDTKNSSNSTTEAKATESKSTANTTATNNSNDKNSTSDKEAYISAYNVFKANGADKAIEPMQSFIKNYPSSVYVPNAQYWLGEFYLAASTPQFSKAKQAFTVVYKKYPTSAKASAAAYRLASMAEVDNDMTTATKIMQDIVKTYPTSKESAYAITFLKKQGKYPLSTEKNTNTTNKSTTTPTSDKTKTTSTPTTKTTTAAVGNAKVTTKTK